MNELGKRSGFFWTINVDHQTVVNSVKTATPKAVQNHLKLKRDVTCVGSYATNGDCTQIMTRVKLDEKGTMARNIAVKICQNARNNNFLKVVLQ